MINHPDKWLMLKLTSEHAGTVYKILGSWYGGYTQGDSWKLSSGTTSMIVHEDYLEFPQASGSVYCGSEENYGLSVYSSGVLDGFIQQVKNGTNTTLEVIKFEDIKDLVFT